MTKKVESYYPYSAKLIHFNFHPPKVVYQYRDPVKTRNSCSETNTKTALRYRSTTILKL